MRCFPAYGGLYHEKTGSVQAIMGASYGLLKVQTKGGFIHEFTRIFANPKSMRGNLRKFADSFPTLRKLYGASLAGKALRFKTRFDRPCYIGYPSARPGMPGAAKPCEPRQDRKIATVRKCLWVPPIPCPDIFMRIPFFCAPPWLLKNEPRSSPRPQRFLFSWRTLRASR